MKKRFAAVLAAAAIVGATSAFAANPFSDVTPADWAYQAVSQLASAGIINGYPDGTFQGQKDVTRYEIAQMVAKAMAHEYRANAEQQAIINQLAAEFAGELNTLGVRVDNVEAKLGKVRVKGDARFEYRTKDNIEYNKANSKYERVDARDTYMQRMRLNLKAEVSDKTSVNARVQYKFNYGENGKDVTFDRLFVNQKLGRVNAIFGRQELFIGNGLFLDDNLDGISASTMLGDKVKLTAGYGYETGIKVYDRAGDQAKDAKGNAITAFDNNQTLVYGQVNAEVAKNVNLGVYGVGFTSSDNAKKVQTAVMHHNVFGATLDVDLAKNLAFSGEYAKRNIGKDLEEGAKGRDAWVAGLTYGNYDMSQPGTANLMLQYFREGENSPIVSTTYHQNADSNLKGWVVEGRYALAKNLGLSLFYAFDQKLVKGEGEQEYPNRTWARLDYKF